MAQGLSKVIKEIKVYEISDISIAAFLLTRGHKIENVSKNEKGQYFFTFIESDKIKKDALMFLSSECSVYDNNMRLLRSLLKAC